MTADDPRPAGEATDGRCNDALHTRGGTLLCSRPAGHFMPHRTASEHTSWSHAGSVEYSFRPAASGGATDGERETWRPVCGCEDGMGHMDRACHSYGLCHAQSAERHAPVASQADGELREALERTIHAGVVSQWQGSMRDDVALTDPRPIVRDLLALPAVRQLLADAAAVQRVRELAQDFAFMANTLHSVPAADAYDDASESLRRALDGDR